MSFGKNPYVAKAQLAEQKAAAVGDRASRQRSYREAAHQWDRAVDREKPGKQRDQYAEHATRCRELADAVDAEQEEGSGPDDGPPKFTLLQ